MNAIYTFSIRLYSVAIWLVSFWNPKAKLWREGRKNWAEKLSLSLAGKQNIYWFHCASLGEFEQARPLIEKIKHQKPSVLILVTFFSPSGYQQRKNYKMADYVCYLPLDTKSNAKHFLSLVSISKAYFVKYEVWPNFFQELKRKEIPFYLLSATFREGQIYFNSLGKWFKSILALTTHIFVQEKASQELLASHGIASIVSGDTRFDQVAKTAKTAVPNKVIEEFSRGKFTLVAGSCWEKEEGFIAAFLSPASTIKVIFAPHDVSENHVKALLARLKPEISCIRYSQFEKDVNLQDFQVLILDNIGLLSNAYQYGSVAFVGGGFTNALHNILEPATFGLPVFYGDNHPKFPEGEEMENHGAGFSIDSFGRFQSQLLSLIYYEGELERYSQKNTDFIQSRTGATELVYSHTIDS